MTKAIWINLPVKDIAKSKAFYKKLGFTPNTQHPDSDDAASFFVGEKEVVLMLFSEASFKNFTNQPIPDPEKGSSVLFSIDAESREEVDEMAKKVKEADGAIYGEPGEKDGWMYGAGFTDPDGHHWNILYMDMSKMPQG